MGLIQAAVGAAGGVLADSWKEYFYCDALDADVLAVKGYKRVNGKRSSNTKGDENVITNGSKIAINEGQCMLIVDNGQVIDVCAEPGAYTYDASTEPSFWTGSLGDRVKDAIDAIKGRVEFGGDAGKDNRIYFINTKEIIGNKFGTPKPIPFRVVDKNIGLDVDISIGCNGLYSYKITDPLTFYTNICGNVTQEYTRDNLDEQLKSEFISALQPSLAKISELGIRYSALPGHTDEICTALNTVLSEKWKKARGIEVATVTINSATASEEDEKMIKELQKNATLRDPNMAAAQLAGAQAQAMQDAAKNSSGAMTGFMGMGMANQAGGANPADLFAMGAKHEQPKAEGWTCECGTVNTGKFCSNCGKPEPTGWTCECGTVNTGKFCSNCGKPMPEEWTCSCGTKNTGKFCSNCGKPKAE